LVIEGIEDQWPQRLILHQFGAYLAEDLDYAVNILLVGDGNPGDRIGEIPGQVLDSRHLAEWNRVYRTGLIAQPDGAHRFDHTRVVFPDIDHIALRVGEVAARVGETLRRVVQSLGHLTEPGAGGYHALFVVTDIRVEGLDLVRHELDLRDDIALGSVVCCAIGLPLEHAQSRQRLAAIGFEVILDDGIIAYCLFAPLAGSGFSQ
jgi:hypothetical protein